MSEYIRMGLLLKEENLQSILNKLPKGEYEWNHFEAENREIVIEECESQGDEYLIIGVGMYFEKPVTITVIESHYEEIVKYLTLQGFTEQDFIDLDLQKENMAALAVMAF